MRDRRRASRYPAAVRADGERSHTRMRPDETPADRKMPITESSTSRPTPFAVILIPTRSVGLTHLRTADVEESVWAARANNRSMTCLAGSPVATSSSTTIAAADGSADGGGSDAGGVPPRVGCCAVADRAASSAAMTSASVNRRAGVRKTRCEGGRITAVVGQRSLRGGSIRRSQSACRVGRRISRNRQWHPSVCDRLRRMRGRGFARLHRVEREHGILSEAVACAK